jgi:hypothetical protein
MQDGYRWIWSVGCEPTTVAKTVPADNSSSANDQYEVVSPEQQAREKAERARCPGFKSGEPDMAAIALRLIVLTCAM